MRNVQKQYSTSSCSVRFWFRIFLGLVIFNFHKEIEATNGVFFERKTEKGSRLVNHVLEKSTVLSSVDCHLKCLQHDCCTSINYNEDFDESIENCELNDAKGSEKQHDLVKYEGFLHYEMVDVIKDDFCCSSPCQNNGACELKQCQCPSGFQGEVCEQVLGDSQQFPGQSCKDIKQRLNTSNSKAYWIKPVNISFQVHCDMTSHGGGWALVYKYTFTEHILGLSNNSVTPRPSWPAPNATVQTSTTAPLHNTSFGALDFAFWKSIGNEFWVNSNINNGYMCNKSSGSIVEVKNGAVACKLVESAVSCTNGTDVPVRIEWAPAGPKLIGRQLPIYNFEGSTFTSSHTPRHNPCLDHREAPTIPNSNGRPTGEIYLR